MGRPPRIPFSSHNKKQIIVGGDIEDLEAILDAQYQSEHGHSCPALMGGAKEHTESNEGDVLRASQFLSQEVSGIFDLLTENHEYGLIQPEVYLSEAARRVAYYVKESEINPFNKFQRRAEMILSG